MKNDTSKSTILVISMGFLVLYFLFAWKWALLTSLLIGILGIFSKLLSRGIEKIWMTFARVLSLIIPKIVLSLVFFLVLFPISLISRLFVKDPLMLSNKYESYFITNKNEFNKKSLENTW